MASCVRQDGAMAIRDAPLNPTQLEVLTWVRDGCADGVYEDFSHRVTARALHNRGLIAVSGHGASWTGSLTGDGAYYLEHGTYPAGKSSARSGRPARRSNVSSRPAAQRLAADEGKKRSKERKLGPVDRLMASLTESTDQLVQVPYREARRYRQLAASAKRFGRIPEGMFLSFDHRRDRGELMMEIALKPLPAWQTAVLDPVPVAEILRDPTDVVSHLMGSQEFAVVGEPRERALRLVEALVVGGRERGMTVSVSKRGPSRRDRYTTGVVQTDTVQFRLEGVDFVLQVRQAILQEAHQPTERELARARRGYVFPDFDDVPDRHLEIELEGDGGEFWASRWKDTDEHRLEDDLAQIVEEIRLRHGNLLQRKEDELKQQGERRRNWEIAREKAVEKYRRQFVLKTMHTQSARWSEAEGLRRYAEAVRDKASRMDADERAQALDWADQIECTADRIDPLATDTLLPKIPEPSPQDLQPFMGSWSSYGP
jgi:hypothetical protein